MKRRMGLIAVIAALSVAACLLSACGDNKITVKVVDTAIETSTGSNISAGTVTTVYHYDDQGLLVSTEQTADSAAAAVNLCKRTFTYNNKNQLVQIDSAFQQYDWNVSYREVFEYRAAQDNSCSTYHTEVLSQGVGTQSTSYEMDDDGQPTSAKAVASSPGSDQPITTDYAFEYLDSGHISKIVNTTSNITTELITGQTNEKEGAFVYRTGSNGQTLTLTFDKNGQLMTRQQVSGSYVSTITYTYKEIKVDKAKYVPTIMSNPQGFDTLMMPSLSGDVIDAIM